MKEALEFIFSDVWIFFGTLLLLSTMTDIFKISILNIGNSLKDDRLKKLYDEFDMKKFALEFALSKSVEIDKFFKEFKENYRSKKV